MSGRLSEAAEQVREAGEEASGRGCWVMVSLGVPDVKDLALEMLNMESSSEDSVIIVQGMTVIQ